MGNNSDFDVRGLLGLALRASRLSLGDEATHELLVSGHARAVFLAEDAGAAICKKIARSAKEHNIAVLTLPCGKEALGEALGRSQCAVCATSDMGFAAAAAKKLAPLSEEHAALASLLHQKNERIMKRRSKPRKKSAGAKITEYIDVEEEDFERRFGNKEKQS